MRYSAGDRKTHRRPGEGHARNSSFRLPLEGLERLQRRPIA